MPLFTIDISDLLSSPVGTTEEFRFAQEVPVDTWEDLVCTDELQMHIKLARQEYGIECLLLSLNATIDIPDEGISGNEIELTDISREFHLKKKPTDTDEIEYINDRDITIDLGNIIRQELLIVGL